MGSDDDVALASSSSDVALPKATVNKFANDIAHSLDVRLTADTRDLIATCCTEFVQLLSSEANDICEKDKKKTITPEHVLRALNQLGLDRFKDDVQDEYERAKIEEQKQKIRLGTKRERNKQAQLDPEELRRKQEELFALARSDPMALSQGPDVSQPLPEDEIQHQLQQQQLQQQQLRQQQQQQHPQ